MKAQYQNYSGNQVPTTRKATETLNNILILGGLAERGSVAHLQNVVREFYPQTFGMKALDLRSGLGIATVALAEMGFQVTALNMYRSSIPALQKIAMQQDLNVSFEKMETKFDLIHDRDSLAQLISDEDRAQFLQGMKEALADGGKFVLTTPVFSHRYNPEDGFESVRLDAAGVLWRQTPDCDIPGIVSMNGVSWTAQKKIARAQMIREEVLAAGFQILSEELEVIPGNQPDLLKYVLTSAQGASL